MRSMLGTIILGLTLHAAACAYSPTPAPTGPRTPIAVARIGFAPDIGLTLAEQAECGLGKVLFAELYDEVGRSFALRGVAEPGGVPGLVLVMRFTRVDGHGIISGIKRIFLAGQLLKDGQVAASFTAMRFTTQGAFGHFNRGFQTTCGIMEDLVEELAEDVGAWLYRPMMNATLGDLRDR
jgi:hypothetical protein